jgi:hypothetical protein
VAGPLVARGLLTALDVGMLAIYCNAVGRIRQCEEMLAGKNLSPEQRQSCLAAKGHYEQEVRKCAAEFLLSPVQMMNLGRAGGRPTP